MLAPLQSAAAAPQPSEKNLLPIHELNLPADVLADLESFAQPVLDQARLLEELPLQGVDPDFVFLAR